MSQRSTAPHHDDERKVTRAPLAGKKRGPYGISLGVGVANEIQICEMGSYGPEGEYVSVGGFSLVPMGDQ